MYYLFLQLIFIHAILWPRNKVGNVSARYDRYQCKKLMVTIYQKHVQFIMVLNREKKDVLIVLAQNNFLTTVEHKNGVIITLDLFLCTLLFIITRSYKKSDYIVFINQKHARDYKASRFHLTYYLSIVNYSLFFHLYFKSYFNVGSSHLF